MCVIIYKPAGVAFPTTEYLQKCWKRNNDGAGIVACNGGLPFFLQKGIMKEEDFFDLVSKLDEKQDVVIHLRIQSRGGVSPELTHPFDFSTDKRKRYFFHNGTIRSLNPTKGKSDSSMFADLLKVVSDPTVDLLIKKQNNFGRFVTVIEKNDGSFNINVYADKESSEINGVWFSNKKHDISTVKPAIGDGGEYYGEFGDWHGGYGSHSSGNHHHHNSCAQSNKNTPSRAFLLRAIAAHLLLQNEDCSSIEQVVTKYNLNNLSNDQLNTRYLAIPS